MRFNPSGNDQTHSSIYSQLPSSALRCSGPPESLTSLAASTQTIDDTQLAGTSDKLPQELLVTASCAYSQEIQLKIKLHVK